MKILLLSFLLFSSNLIEYKNHDFHFLVKLPENYKIENMTYDEKFASIESIRISADMEVNSNFLKGNLIYRVICQRYKGKAIIEAQKLDLHDVIIAYSKHQTTGSLEANNLSVETFKENGDTFDYVLVNKSIGIKEHRRIIIYENYSYALSIMSKAEFIKDDNVAQFFNSLIIN